MSDRTVATSARFYMIVYIVVAGVGLAIQLLALGGLRDILWGFHLFAFIHPVAMVFAAALIAFAAIGFLRAADDGSSQAAPRTPAVFVFVLLWTALLWGFRSQNLFLGDGLSLTMDLARGQDFHPRQPLTMWLQQTLYRFAGPVVRRDGMLDDDVAQHVVALGSVLAGLCFALVSVAMGRLFARTSGHPPAVSWLVTLVLVSQGYALLFFGYVENYAYYALAIAVYLYLSLRFIGGRSALLLPGLTLIAALALHLSAVVLAPSFAVLAGWAVAKRERRRSAIADLAICAAAFIALNIAFDRFWGYSILSTLVDVSGQATEQQGDLIPGYMTSSAHVRDFLNEHFLIGPFALFAFLPAAGVALTRPDRGSVSTVFLLTAGAVYLVACWMAGDSNLGYARNWDLMAPAGVCFTAIALYFLVHHVPSSPRATQLLLFGFVASAVHLAAWVWVNHDEDRAARRFATLPLGLGRTEMVLGNWHLRSERQDEAVEWLTRAVDVNPNNAPAHALLGVIHTRDGRHEAARDAYARAVTLRPDKLEFRHNYAMALIDAGQSEAALAELEEIIRRWPDKTEYQRLRTDIELRLQR